MIAHPNEITVKANGDVRSFGTLANSVFLSLSWPTGENTVDVLRALATNPNYTDAGDSASVDGSTEHAFWVEWKSPGVCALRPALVEPGDVADLYIVLETRLP